ncbi:hypothetical protein TNCV_4652571 [Trichonephila clavipes]|nr:hypothetical protein TNCV_4652571 [Trichonephila clavipes]
MKIMIQYWVTNSESLRSTGVKDSACCPLCHQGERDGDHLRHCSIVLKLSVDNPMEANFNSFLLRHHFIGLLVDLQQRCRR